jgi:hypothetical protein
MIGEHKFVIYGMLASLAAWHHIQANEEQY